MFLIHADQVEAFAAQVRGAFVARAATLVGHRLRREVSTLEVQASMERAFRRLIETEPEVLQHVAIECAIGGDLETLWPWAGEVLSSVHLSPLGKLKVILRRSVARGIDPSAFDLALVVARAS